MWVSPFRYLRLTVYLPLPAAFRSLSRLSSALSAKASALRSFQLNLFVIYTQRSINNVYFLNSFRCLYLHHYFCFSKMFPFPVYRRLDFDLRYSVFKVRFTCENKRGYMEECLHSDIYSFCFSCRYFVPACDREALLRGFRMCLCCGFLHSGLKWTRTTDLTLIRRAL